MKHEWRKKEKEIYLPKNKPVRIKIPEYKFYTIEGRGNPNDDFFPEYIGVLYSLSYAIKMSPKKGMEPEGYYDYTVYPLEGVWDINEEAKKNFNGVLDKDSLIFKLMIFIFPVILGTAPGRTKWYLTTKKSVRTNLLLLEH